MNQIDLAQTIEEWRDIISAEEEGPVSHINVEKVVANVDQKNFFRKNWETFASRCDTFQPLES